MSVHIYLFSLKFLYRVIEIYFFLWKPAHYFLDIAIHVDTMSLLLYRFHIIIIVRLLVYLRSWISCMYMNFFSNCVFHIIYTICYTVLLLQSFLINKRIDAEFLFSHSAKSWCIMNFCQDRSLFLSVYIYVSIISLDNKSFIAKLNCSLLVSRRSACSRHQYCWTIA